MQRVHTCHTAASLRPSRSSSLVEGALASLGLEALQQGARLPVGAMAMEDSTAAIIELAPKLCRGLVGSARPRCASSRLRRARGAKGAGMFFRSLFCLMMMMMMMMMIIIIMLSLIHI